MNGAVGRSVRRLLLVAGTAVGLAACSSFIGGDNISVRHTGEDGPPQTVSASSDAAIGQREHPRIVAAHGGIYEDRKAEIMIAGMAGKLLNAAHRDESQLTVTILDTPEVNAFALPGGYIYVTRGILALANDESELAAILAHELSHIILKHARARSDRQRTTEIVNKVINGVLGGNAETDQGAARARLSLAAFSQAQELAADKEGIIIASHAGFDPSAAARFLSAMGRFAKFSGDADQGDDFLSSHPSTPDRIEKAVKIAQGLEEGQPHSRYRTAYLDAIDGLEFGDNPDKGAIVGHRYLQPDLGFTFEVPARYTLQLGAGAVVGVAGEGEAVRFDSAAVPAGMELSDYLKSGWIAGLKPETIHSEDVDGVAVASGEAVTDKWIFRIAVLRFKGDVYRFIFATRQDSTAFRQAVEETVASFRATRKSDLRRIRHLKVRIVTAKGGDTIDTLAAQMSGVDKPTQLFLVLNSLYAGDPVIPGTEYKIVVVE